MTTLAAVADTKGVVMVWVEGSTDPWKWAVMPTTIMAQVDSTTTTTTRIAWVIVVAAAVPTNKVADTPKIVTKDMIALIAMAAMNTVSRSLLKANRIIRKE